MKEAAEKAAKYIKKRKTKAKPTEEKSFAQFAKKCEAEGLLESKPPEEGSSKDEASKAAKGSRTASPLPANFNPEANLSNMSKEQADKHQEEMLTWQDRWHQNKKVRHRQQNHVHFTTKMDGPIPVYKICIFLDLLK